MRRKPTIFPADAFKMIVEGIRSIIDSAQHPRQGWDEHFKAMARCGNDGMVEQPTSTQWEEEEWTW